jgi:hypothetical protein
MLSIRGTNFRSCSASGIMWTFLHVRVQSMLSIRGTNFIAHWAYWELISSHAEHAEPISSHAEHARKCLKVEYLGRIEYDFQKSRVTGPWNHKVSVSAKKVKKMSCLCTFKWVGTGIYGANRGLGSFMFLSSHLPTTIRYKSLFSRTTFFLLPALEKGWNGGGVIVLLVGNNQRYWP